LILPRACRSFDEESGHEAVSTLSCQHFYGNGLSDIELGGTEDIDEQAGL